jgi:ATP-dependent DNA helicase 2 subunit 1
MDFDDLFGGNGGVDGTGADDGGDLFMFGNNETGEGEELRDQKDSVIFLIDCHASMFKQNPNNGQPTPDCDSTSSIDSVLRAALSFMKTKIITNDNDKIGIVLYGSKKTDNSLNLDNIAVMQKLDQSDASTIKSFQQQIDGFESEFGFAAKNE